MSRLKNGDVLLGWPLTKHQLTAGNYYRGSDGSYRQWHGAIDMRAAVGTPVYAAEAGTVDWVQAWDGRTKTGNQSYGNCCRIKHSPYAGGTLQTLYAHLQSVAVKYGVQVAEGQLIGYAGNSGNSGGAHLHFEVRWRGVRRNPLCWLDDDFEAASGYTPYTYGSGEGAVQRPAEPAAPKSYTATVCANSLRLRTLPDADEGEVLATLDNGKTYPLVQTRSGWAFLAVDGSTGGWAAIGDAEGTAQYLSIKEA